MTAEEVIELSEREDGPRPSKDETGNPRRAMSAREVVQRRLKGLL